MVILKVADILRESIVDGKGMRAVVFFQGCPRHCRGCHNEQLLPFEGGRGYTPEALSAEILQLLTPLHRGVTFSGGDPLAQPLRRVGPKGSGEFAPIAWDARGSRVGSSNDDAARW